MAALQSSLGAIGTAIKAGIHGVIGGAISIAHGGSFLQGFAGSAAGVIGGAIAGESGLVGHYRDGVPELMLGRALISGAAGCLGAIATGGKCAQAAVTAAFASLYNGDDVLGKDKNDKWYERINKQHREGVEIVQKMLEKEGYITVSSGPVAANVTGFSTPRYYDLIMYDPVSKVNVGIEVKTTSVGTIYLEDDQLKKDIQTLIGGTKTQVTGTPINTVRYEAYCTLCGMVPTIKATQLWSEGLMQGLSVRSTCKPSNPC